MLYTVDQPRAEVVLGPIWKRFDERGIPYTNYATTLPQAYLPARLELGGNDEVWYWLIVCQWMSGGNNTSDSAKMIALLHENSWRKRRCNPFNLEQAASMSEQQILRLMKQAGLGMDHVAEQWIRNAHTIIDHFDGKPLDFFRSLKSGEEGYEEACQALLSDQPHGLAGFRHKMVSMILYFLTERGLIEGSYPPPIDFHLQRIAFATKIIQYHDPSDPVVAKSERYFDELEAMLRQLYFQYSQEHHIPVNRLADALWVLSRSLCRFNPGNRTHQIGPFLNRGTVLRAHEPEWSNSSTVRAFERSCGSCPVRQHCSFNVPAGPRYRHGRLVLSPRLEPPQEQLVMPVNLVRKRISKKPAPPTAVQAPASEATEPHPSLFDLPGPTSPSPD